MSGKRARTSSWSNEGPPFSTEYDAEGEELLPDGTKRRARVRYTVEYGSQMNEKDTSLSSYLESSSKATATPRYNIRDFFKRSKIGSNERKHDQKQAVEIIDLEEPANKPRLVQQSPIKREPVRESNQDRHQTLQASMKSRKLDEVNFRGTKLRHGTTVELQPNTFDHTFTPKPFSMHTTFLRIEGMEQHFDTKAVYLIGFHFRRNRHCGGVMKANAGEVVRITTRTVKVDIKDVVQIRELILTNAIGLMTYRKAGYDAFDDDNGRLICRFNFKSNIDVNFDTQGVSGIRAIGKCGKISRISCEEADEGFGDNNCTALDSSQSFTNSTHNTIGRTKEIKSGSSYTFGDICCGAGGATVGAEMAGFKTIFGNDKDVNAMRTWVLNRTDQTLVENRAQGFCEDAFDFVTQSAEAELGVARHVDLLHVSIPCQPYSPAHTVPGKDDEFNTAMTMIIGEPLKRLQPRVVTIEETDGIIRLSEHRHYFFAILWQFIEQDYNVSWNVMEALEYGCVSRRSRLILIASRPGEPLPEYPHPTHYMTSNQEVQIIPQGLQPARTVGQALSSLPPAEMSNLVGSINLNAPFLRTLTTGNLNNLTNKQKALLQSFPPGYKFVGNKTSVSRQSQYSPLFAI